VGKARGRWVGSIYTKTLTFGPWISWDSSQEHCLTVTLTFVQDYYTTSLIVTIKWNKCLQLDVRTMTSHTIKCFAALQNNIVDLYFSIYKWLLYIIKWGKYKLRI
jgi:hypothetical protein